MVFVLVLNGFLYFISWCSYKQGLEAWDEFNIVFECKFMSSGEKGFISFFV